MQYYSDIDEVMRILITKSIGSLDGASQSALDVLLALTQSSEIVNVITQKKSFIPNELDGYSIENIGTYKAPEFYTYHDSPIKPSVSRNISRIIFGSLLDQYRINKITKLIPNLVLINSFSAHRFWLQIYKTLNWKGVLIIRESPRHTVSENSQSSCDNTYNYFNYYEKFIFVSEIVMHKWIDIYPQIKQVSVTIPNCVHEDEINSIKLIGRQKTRNLIGIKNEHFNVVCVANIKYRKGHDKLFEAIPKIVSKIPDFKFIFVGSTKGRFAKNLIHEIKQSPYRENIVIIGRREDALKFIYAADALILPSRAEALPRVILEAMVLGTPIVATMVDGIPELVSDGKSAILFEPDDINKMIEGFVAIRQQNIGFELAKEAEQNYWTKFSRKLQIQRYTKFIEAE